MAAAEKIANDLHAVQQNVIDDFQRRIFFQCQREIFFQAKLFAVNDVIFQPLFDRGAARFFLL